MIRILFHAAVNIHEVHFAFPDGDRQPSTIPFKTADDFYHIYFCFPAVAKKNFHTVNCQCQIDQIEGVYLPNYIDTFLSPKTK